MTRVLGVLAMAMLVLSACGGGAAPAAASAAPAFSSAAPATTAAATTAATAAASAAAGEVTVQGFSFKPGSLDVKAGTKVTSTNKDGTGHTTTSGTPGSKDGKWDGQLSGSGGTFAFTFAQAGTFAYFCSIHGASMTGTVIVK